MLVRPLLERRVETKNTHKELRVVTCHHRVRDTKKCVQKQNESSSGKLRQLIAIDDIFE